MNEHARAKFATARLLDQRRDRGHDDSHRTGKVATMPCQGQRVIARTRGDDATALGFWREVQHRVARTALLEAARALLVLEFDEDFAASNARKCWGIQARRAFDTVTDAHACRDDVGERDIFHHARRRTHERAPSSLDSPSDWTLDSASAAAFK